MTVAGYISVQPETQREVLTILRSWILDLGPHAQEKISYKVPFFYFYGPLCYLNPNGDGIDLSFTRGTELDDENKLLELRGRKQVKSITFYSIAEVEEHEEEIRRLLNEAAILNEYHATRRQKKKKKS
jgi:uncharacterized protein YdhG (YjbR/CyaY superfamily)